MSNAVGSPTLATMDRWRIGVTLFGAFFQVIVGFFVPVGRLVNREVSLIIPAGWTFAIWGPIFLLCFVFAGYQLLPSRRYDPLLRSVGWPLARFRGKRTVDPDTTLQATDTLSSRHLPYPDPRPHGAGQVCQVW